MAFQRDGVETLVLLIEFSGGEGGGKLRGPEIVGMRLHTVDPTATILFGKIPASPELLRNWQFI